MSFHLGKYLISVSICLLLPQHDFGFSHCKSPMKPSISNSEALFNFHGKTLRVTAVKSEEYSYDTDVQTLPHGGFKFKDSFAVEILRALELTLNFKSIPIITDLWGHLLPNGSWTGMISLLISNKADLGLSSIADLPFRRKVVDFNFPTNEIRLSAFFPKVSSFKSSALLNPFEPWVWICIVLLLIVFLLFSSLLLHYYQQEEQRQRNFLEPFSYSFLWSFSALALKSCSRTVAGDLHNLNSLRILEFVGSLTGVVILAAYAGVLTASLAVVSEPIQSLEQLLSTDFTFAVTNDPIALKFLAESPDARSLSIFQRRLPNSMYYSVHDAQKDLKAGSFVFVSDTASAYESLRKDFSPLEACRVREFVIDYGQQKQGTIIPKNSTYKRIIDYQILRMIEYGLVKRWTNQYLPKRTKCDERAEFESVEIESILYAFGFLIAFGFGIGTGTLLLEIFIQKRHNFYYFQ